MNALYVGSELMIPLALSVASKPFAPYPRWLHDPTNGGHANESAAYPALTAISRTVPSASRTW